jgi:hypothetical protein
VVTPTETVLYDVSDFKVYALTADTGASPTYGAAVDVPGIAQVGLDPNFLTAELKGDAKIIARRGRVDKVKIAATYGKLSQTVLAIIMGGTVTSGSGTSGYLLKGTNSLPYFKCAFTITDADVGSVNVTLYKAQLTGGTLISQQTDNFGQPTMDVEGIPLTSNDNMFAIDFYDALTALPS